MDLPPPIRSANENACIGLPMGSQLSRAVSLVISPWILARYAAVYMVLAEVYCIRCRGRDNEWIMFVVGHWEN